MVKRLISSCKSEIRTMKKNDLIKSIKESEGRVILSQNAVCHAPLNEGSTNAEIAEMFGADMIFFNAYSMDPEHIHPGLSVEYYQDGDYHTKNYRVKDMKKLVKSPIGVYLECRNTYDNPNEEYRVASDQNFKRLLDEKADFVVLGGNPGSGATLDAVIEATKRAKKVVGDEIMIWAGKWEDGVYDPVLGDPRRTDSKEIIKQLIDAGADVICLPMPGSRTGITVNDIRDLITFIHTYNENTLAMAFLDGSVEGSDDDTIRECALLSKQTGADIHAIGDAGVSSGIASPEGIYQLCISIKGKRLTWYKMASGHK